MDCSLQGSSVHRILQARILEWVAISFSKNIPGDVPDSGVEPGSPVLQADSLPSEPLGKNHLIMTVPQICFTWPVTCLSWITWSPSFVGDIQILTGNNTFWNSVFDPLFLYLSWLPSMYCLTVFSFSFKIVSSMGKSLCLCNYYLHYLGQNCYSVQFSSVTQSCPTLCDPMDWSMPASLSITNSWSLLKLTSIELVMPSNNLILCRLFSSCPQFFPTSGSFLMSQLFVSGDQSIGASISASVLPMNIQDWFPLGLTGLISLLSKGLSRVFSNTSSKASILRHSAFFMVPLSHPYMTTGKTIALTRQTFVREVMSLLFKMLSRFVIAFLPKSKRLLISWLQSRPQWFWSPRK